jgi:hypothetical protein
MYPNPSNIKNLHSWKPPLPALTPPPCPIGPLSPTPPVPSSPRTYMLPHLARTAFLTPPTIHTRSFPSLNPQATSLVPFLRLFSSPHLTFFLPMPELHICFDFRLEERSVALLLPSSASSNVCYHYTGREVPGTNVGFLIVFIPPHHYQSCRPRRNYHLCSYFFYRATSCTRRRSSPVS